MQYLRKGHGGLPAFRRLIGKPILSDVKLQDVVFASGRNDCGNPQSVRWRASVTPVSVLGDEAVILEKHDLKSVRLGLLQMIEAGAASVLEQMLPEYGPPPLVGLSIHFARIRGYNKIPTPAARSSGDLGRPLRGPFVVSFGEDVVKR